MTAAEARATPLTSGFAARVDGLALDGPVGPAAAARLRSALARHGVLVLGKQELSPAQLLAGAAAIGRPGRQNYSQFNHPDHPDIGIIRYDEVQTPADTWHTDHTNRECPPKATILYAVEVPDRGGDTSFADMRAACAALPAATKRRIEGLRTVNTFDGQFEVSDADRRAFGAPVVHPLVRTHPETGAKALYFHILKTARIEGMSARASRELLSGLLRQAIRPEFVYRHRWSAGDLVIIDNRSVMHRVHDDYDRSENRLLHRVIVAGDRPF